MGKVSGILKSEEDEISKQNKKDAHWQKVNVVESGHNGGFGAGNDFAIEPVLELNSPPVVFLERICNISFIF